MRFALLCCALALTAGLRAATSPFPAGTPLAAAWELFAAKRYPEARVAFEKIATAEPKNAAAAFYLGRCIEPRADANALPEALAWYQKAIELEPNNALYLARYGGASLQLAGRTSSVGAATRGRDAMEKAIKLNPDDLDARDGLMQFYQRAPWPLGSNAKAAAQLEEIRKRDPDRATMLEVRTKTQAKDYAGAFQACERILAKKPGDYTALYYYGRTASISGENLARGLECLKQAATLTPPGPAAPPLDAVWNRIGLVEEKLSHSAAARTAYETALKLNPANTEVRAALARLK